MLFAAGPALPLVAASFSPGDLVHLMRGEMLSFDGKDLTSGTKGQEFSVVRHDLIHNLVEVVWYKEAGSVIVATLPTDALQLTLPNGWMLAQKGLLALRDQRLDEAKRFLALAAQDQACRTLMAPLSAQINNALSVAAPASRQNFAAALQALRDSAEQFSKLGYFSLALLLDDATDALAARVAGLQLPASKLKREELTASVAISNRSLGRARQLIGQRRLSEAWKLIKEGLRAEPARPELKALHARVERDRDEADEQYSAAMRMRRFPGGESHALNAIERGLKLCADHLRLRELKKEMQIAFEEHTAPPVTPAFLANAKTKTPAAVLDEGRKLYTARCTECHDLELISSRSIDGWQKMVASMGRRAHMDQTQQARILDYLAAAQNSLNATNQ